MNNNLDTLRAIVRESLKIPVARDIDPDLDREAGMDGNLGRLLQAARYLDTDEDLRQALLRSRADG